MSRLILPPKVEAEIQKRKWIEQRAERRALLFRMLNFDHPTCREWNPVLRDLDPFLTLAKARDQAYEPGMHIRPGYWHWVRDNPTADLTVEAITGPDGWSYAEPDSSLLERLRANDLQNPHVWRAVIEAQAAREAEREKRVQADRDEINTEVYERYRAGTQTSVSMNDATPWSQNAAGRRGVNRS